MSRIQLILAALLLAFPTSAEEYEKGPNGGLMLDVAGIDAELLTSGTTVTIQRMASRTKGNSLIAAGTACFGMVILTHVAESFHIFPSMGWGQPDSVGHYLDLISAVLGCILIPLGFAINYGSVNQ